MLEKIIQQKIEEDLFSDYYVPNVRIKDFNVLIEGKSFFDLPIKMKKKPTKKL